MVKIILSPLFLSLLALIIGEILFFYKWKKLDLIMRSFLLILVLGTAPLLLFSLPVIAQILYLPLQYQTSQFMHNSSEGIDAVVVLRGGSDPSRVIQGVLAFNDYSPHFLVLSGYSGDEIILSPKKDIWKIYALRLGIPDDRILTEYNSKNTFEHPLELLKMHEINKNLRIGIVTSTWHMPRAIDEFSRYFQNVKPIPVEYKFKNLDWLVKPWFPQADALKWSSLMIHEYIGSFWYKIRHGEYFL